MPDAPITAAMLVHADRRPDDVALVIGGQSWSWRKLVDDMQQRAHAMPKSGVKANPELPTFTAHDVNLVNAVFDGLARLHLGWPIIGTTSGSTAAAKRYRRSQESWIASFDADRQEFGITPADVIMAPGSLSHSLFSYALCHGLFVGAKVVLAESFRPDRVLRQIAEHQATVLVGVPTQLKLLLHAADGATFPSVRLLLSSGARWFEDMTDDLQAIFFRAEIVEFYGASETSFISLARHGTDAHLPIGSVGKAFVGVNLKFDDHGTIFVSSPGLFDGYIGVAPKDFSEHTDARGQRWISVGDVGHVNEEGYLFLRGRQSRKIITSGKNLYPEEVEQALLTHPFIEHAAVIGAGDELRGERLVAIIGIGATSPAPTRAQIIAMLRPLLDDFKIPRDMFVLDHWPMTGTGKTDFAAVCSAWQEGRARPLSTE